MIKKIFIICLCAFLLLSLCSYAEEMNLENIPQGPSNGEMPQPPEGFTPGEKGQIPENGFVPGEGRQRPAGNFAPDENTQMPKRDFVPPENSQIPETNPAPNGNMQSSETNPAPDGNMQIPEDGFAPGERSQKNQNGQNAQRGDIQRNAPEMNMDGGFPPNDEFRNNRQFPGNFNMQMEPVEETPKTFKEIVIENITPIISVILLAFAFVFVIFYKRKTY